MKLRGFIVSYGLRNRCTNGLLAIAAALLPWSSVQADEGGTSFWLPGSYSSFAAVPQEPGWYIPTQIYYYHGNADGDKRFERGGRLNLGLSSRETLVFVSPTWVPDTKWLGGQPSYSLTFGGGSNSTSADLALSSAHLGRVAVDRSDTDSGGTDLVPQAQIAWSNGNKNWMAYITGDIPTGSYNSTRLADIGLGHTAVDIGGAYTYSDNSGGFEASATLGFTRNGKNPSTDYRSGIDSHLDWDVSQTLSSNWQVGVAGYVYYQLTGDSGSGNHTGSFKSRVAAVGPELDYTIGVGGEQWSANLRGYWEFWAQNRLEGHAIFGTLSIPLGGGPKQVSP